MAVLQVAYQVHAAAFSTHPIRSSTDSLFALALALHLHQPPSLPTQAYIVQQVGLKAPATRLGLKSKALTSAVIAGCSDVLAQGLISGRYSNWRRTLALAAFGLVWSGPSAHYWEMFMEWLFSGESDGFTMFRKVRWLGFWYPGGTWELGGVRGGQGSGVWILNDQVHPAYYT